MAFRSAFPHLWGQDHQSRDWTRPWSCWEPRPWKGHRPWPGWKMTFLRLGWKLGSYHEIFTQKTHQDTHSPSVRKWLRLSRKPNVSAREKQKQMRREEEIFRKRLEMLSKALYTVGWKQKPPTLTSLSSCWVLRMTAWPEHVFFCGCEGSLANGTLFCIFFATVGKGMFLNFLDPRLFKQDLRLKKKVGISLECRCWQRHRCTIRGRLCRQGAGI